MVVQATENSKERYALDKWLRRLGLWSGGMFSGQSPQARGQALFQMDFSKGFTFSRSDYDGAGQMHINATSYSGYNPETGWFEDKLIYWRLPPYTSGDKVEPQDQYVLQILGKRDPDQDPDNPVPVILPEQIWWNGAQIFQGTMYGGVDSPTRSENIRLYDRMMELSRRGKDLLRGDRPVHELGRIMAEGSAFVNMAKGVTGSKPGLRGVNDTGWDPHESYLHEAFVAALGDRAVRLHLPPIEARDEDELSLSFRQKAAPILTPFDRLQAVHGHIKNSMEPARHMGAGREDIGVNMQSGMSYLIGSLAEYDAEKDRYILRHSISPEDVPMDMEAPEPLDLIRLEYSLDGDVFTMEDAQFMGNCKGDFKTLKDRHKVKGALTEINECLARGEYPDYCEIFMNVGLLEHISDFGIPSKLSETGGDVIWFSLYGRNIEELFDSFQTQVGGGNVYMRRGMRDDNTLDEVAWMHDFPTGLGGPNSNYDGIVPDLMPYLAAIRRGGFFISHDHFDHASLEFLAKQKDENGYGYLRGVRTICRSDVAYIIRDHLKNMGVPAEDWPELIEYDNGHPDIVQLDEQVYAYASRDEDGKVTSWLQICKDGSMHSSRCDIAAITFCDGDDQYKTTYVNEGDARGYYPHGWHFMENVLNYLAQCPGVTAEKIWANIKNPDQQYILHDESTGITVGGKGVTVEEFKTSIRHVLKSLPPGLAVSHHTFSTNSLEKQAVHEVCNEPETLRHHVAIGANAETRDTVMNKFGVDPFLDLQKVKIPPEKLPQSIYDAFTVFVDNYCRKRIGEAQRKVDKGAQKTKKRLNEILGNDAGYQVFNHIRKKAEKERKKGNTKPLALYKAFLSGNPMAYEDEAVEIGLPTMLDGKPRDMYKIIENTFKEAVDARKAEINGNRVVDYLSDTELFMLRSLAKHGKVTFTSRCAWNDKHQYEGIMRGQEKVSVRFTRGSRSGKALRDDPGGLLCDATGATGTQQEWEAALSRYARGESLYDQDNATGYKIDEQKLVFLITQTPSMGEDAIKGQESIIKDIVNNRGNMVFCATRNGMKIYNPKQHRAHYEEYYANLGYKVRWDGAGKTMLVEGFPTHLGGHRSFDDQVEKYKDLRLKAKLIEAIHIAGTNNFARWLEALALGGRRCSIMEPQNHVAYQETKNPETGLAEMKAKDYLRPSYFLYNLRRKYGQQYGGILEMTRVFLMRNFGNMRQDAFGVRRSKDSAYVKKTTWESVSAGHTPFHGSIARQKTVGPSLANVQTGGGKPMGMSMSALLRQQKLASRVQQRAGARGASLDV